MVPMPLQTLNFTLKQTSNSGNFTFAGREIAKEPQEAGHAPLCMSTWSLWHAVTLGAVIRDRCVRRQLVGI